MLSRSGSKKRRESAGWLVGWPGLAWLRQCDVYAGLGWPGGWRVTGGVLIWARRTEADRRHDMINTVRQGCGSRNYYFTRV
jgi:hypothetical protein